MEGNEKGERNQQLRSILPGVPQEGIERLAVSLSRTEIGYDRDLRTPFGGARPRDELTETLAKRIGPSPYEEFERIDEHERSKIGPLSIMLPYAERRNDVRAYEQQTFDADEAVLDQAASNVSSLVPSGMLRVASFQTAYGMMPKDTSLGLPWVTRDKSFVMSYYHRATMLDSPEGIFPAILYWRGQAAGPNETKQRVVAGFDHAETIFGATILYPVLDALRQLPGFSAWLGDVDVDKAITDLLHVAAGRTIISMDYSGFDRSLHAKLLERVDWVLSTWFAEPGPSRISLLATIDNHVPIVVPWELEWRNRTGGEPSGSVLTNLRDTVANLIAGEYAGLRAKSKLMRYEVLGDDSVFVFQNDLEPKRLSTLVAELGLESNPEKQFISKRSAHYLQRWHSLDYIKDGLARGVRSPYRALPGVFGYERWRSDWNKYLDSSRWIMQFENLKNHWAFEECVRYLRDNDIVLRSGMDPVTIFKRAGGADVIRSTLNIASFPFNVQNPENVNVFRTTEVLRSLD